MVRRQTANLLSRVRFPLPSLLKESADYSSTDSRNIEIDVRLFFFPNNLTSYNISNV